MTEAPWWDDGSSASTVHSRMTACGGAETELGTRQRSAAASSQHVKRRRKGLALRYDYQQPGCRPPSRSAVDSPGKRALSSSRCDATPTGQLLVWHTRAMMQPVAIIATVPKPYSSAPSAAITSTSRPVRMPPSHRRATRSRRPLVVRIW